MNFNLKKMSNIFRQTSDGTRKRVTELIRPTYGYCILHKIAFLGMFLITSEVVSKIEGTSNVSSN